MGFIGEGREKMVDEFIARSYNEISKDLFNAKEWELLVKCVKYHTKTGKPRDLWRYVFEANDPPAKVPPFKIQLKPNVEPYIAKARKYNDEETRFLKLWNSKFIADGLGYINHESRWASRVLPVKKTDHEVYKKVKESRPLTDEEVIACYRETVDYVVVNSKCVPAAGQMPFQDVEIEKAAGCKYHGVFDFMSGFNQIAMEPKTAEILSSRTPLGIVTKYRWAMWTLLCTSKVAPRIHYVQFWVKIVRYG